MPTLSIGANIAWQIAAAEASAGRFQFIEAEHILIGILSLEKALMLSPEDLGLNPNTIKSLHAEYVVLKDLLGQQGLNMTILRRTARKEAGAGSYKHTENVIHRSPACKMMFNRAFEIAYPSDEASSLHLLASILENPGNIISSALVKAGISPDVFLKHLLAQIAKEEKELAHDNGAEGRTPAERDRKSVV